MKKISLKITTIILAFVMMTGYVRADEGMWLPMLVKRLNEADMKANGLKLTAEEIYSVNNSSMKDAIFGLGFGDPSWNFCTSEAISSKGLLLTNHHCAFDMIQNHSTVENDYLTDGFWAKSLKEELPNAGITASVLVKMEDVTERVKKALDGLSLEEQAAKLEEIKAEIIVEATKDTHYKAYVKDFFYGNEYYLFVSEVFLDVRLVGAPPSSIGKFGGDTDNWMWPRHTGDFSLLRIYADKDGKPAEYSTENVPLKPKHSLPVSMKGVEKNDFAMVFGFPGSTQRFKTSYGLDVDYAATNPARIKLREARLSLMKEQMDVDAATRIAYASKYAGISNYYKYFIGQNAGLKRLKTIDKKRVEEKEYQIWADASGNEAYSTALSRLDKAYSSSVDYSLWSAYFQEAFFGSEIVEFGVKFLQLQRTIAAGVTEENQEQVDEMIEKLKESTKEHFAEYNATVDKNVTGALLGMFYEDIDKQYHPEIFERIASENGSDFNKYATVIFENSAFASEEKTMQLLENMNAEVLDKDPIMQLITSVLEVYYTKVRPQLSVANEEIASSMKDYVAGLLVKNKDKTYYPDANSTLRLSYGNVEDYSPKDGVKYQYFTTLEGVAEKYIPNDGEFDAPKALLEMQMSKEYGKYADKDGTLHVGFITNNDITGGNSGSPVINGNGELIGLAFDGNWEAMTGDLVFDEQYKRCINVDIRYVLFCIDKLAGASHLIDEMNLVTANKGKKGK
ncbi:Peptidase S46 [Bernardetia litoralis DSM 6794]|uniref:Dipeptidyl-peptidase n=1 Tax=Bernardetia litoralis (strain ATCC 23117 / DSM 6794 / NBRC 15988 / NCIMB 1366 / Fx l1 / Sio-4) TaxID=880071 RepID=I4AQF9_BERLS|nr:S46 family peptidase [Bernardetia litoralis]AFM06194.1 Peptidase S46 [Bernardetia litoralis DSM 6794]